MENPDWDLIIIPREKRMIKLPCATYTAGTLGTKDPRNRYAKRAFDSMAMMILSSDCVRTYYGHKVIRPRDKSCWILVSPTGKSTQYFTRKDAINMAKKRSQNQ